MVAMPPGAGVLGFWVGVGSSVGGTGVGSLPPVMVTVALFTTLAMGVA